MSRIKKLFIVKKIICININNSTEKKLRMTKYIKIDKLVRQFTEQDYEKDEKLRTVNLTEIGINNIESMLVANSLIVQDSSLYDFENLSLVHYINQSL